MTDSGRVIHMRKHTARTSFNADAKSIDLAERLRRFRLQANIAQPKLAEMIGVNRNSISNWEAGRRRPDMDLVPKVCEALGITLDQFFGIDDPVTAEDKKLLECFHEMDEPNKKAFRHIGYNILDAQHEREYSEQRAYLEENHCIVPLSEELAAAGYGEWLDSNPEVTDVYLYRDEDVERADQLIRITGDSMEPTYKNGDVLLVEHTSAVDVGEIGIFILDGKGFVKEYQGDHLHSHNPEYPNIMLKDYDSTYCYGRVLRALTPDDYMTDEDIAILTGRD